MKQPTGANHFETQAKCTKLLNGAATRAHSSAECDTSSSSSSTRCRSTSNSSFLKLFAFLFLALVYFNHIQVTSSCDIVGASACPHKPDNDLKEENFEEYCNKYKQNLECVYKKYKGCDRKEKYVEAMESMVKGLRKKAKQIEKLCEIDIDVPDEVVKAVNSSQDFRTNGKSGGGGGGGGKKGGDSKPATTGPPCKISLISPDCTPILTNVQFNPAWNGVNKQKWCNSATAYYNCIKSRLHNCVGVQYMESLSYYEKIEKYIHSQSNINCPGGLEGCVANPNDVRCKMGVKYGETNAAAPLARMPLATGLATFLSLVLFSICIYFSK